MKKLVFFLLLIGSMQSLFSQETYSLRECKQMAVANFPKMQQADLMQQISDLKNENTRGSFLPSLEIKGQATYQSEVIELDLPVPGFDFEPVSKDQYKIYFDVKQTIWDGGLSKRMQELEQVALDAQLQGLQIEIHQLEGMVENTFFSILQLDKSIQVLQAQQAVLDKQSERLKAALENGAAKEKDILKIELEFLGLDQKINELKGNHLMLLQLLSEMMGKTLNEDVELELPHQNVVDYQQQRPEFELFSLQQIQLDKSNLLIEAGRKPRLFGFGQAGYGKPGFNMLKNEFDPYYIVGVGINWKITDWNNSKRLKQMNLHRKGLISSQIEDFEQKINLQLIEARSKIDQIEKQIQTDNELVRRSERIAGISAEELANGSITSADYLVDLNAEMVTKINRELHAIQLAQSIVKYNSILGY